MFHVEQTAIENWASERGLSPDFETTRKLILYAVQIQKANFRHNLTGLKDLQEIIRILVLGSLEPLLHWKVPRGTRFVDVGSGAGIPGIPLGILFPGMTGVLVESHRKKAAFIDGVVSELGLHNLSALCARVEEAARSKEYRESFDCAFARAFGRFHVVSEVALPLVKPGGFLYVYAGPGREEQDGRIASHLQSLGGEFMPSRGPCFPESPPGLLVVKNGSTPLRYPRRYAVIKRECRRHTV